MVRFISIHCVLVWFWDFFWPLECRELLNFVIYTVFVHYFYFVIFLFTKFFILIKSYKLSVTTVHWNWLIYSAMWLTTILKQYFENLFFLNYNFIIKIWWHKIRSNLNNNNRLILISSSYGATAQVGPWPLSLIHI